MNYSFIDNYKASDFIENNTSKLYNTFNKKSSITDINLETNNYYNSYEQNNMDNWKTENSIAKSVLRGLSQVTPLAELFFSPNNINRIQKMIKYEVFKRSNGKYILQVDQNETDVIHIMYQVYGTAGENTPYKLISQVKRLNKLLVEYILSDMLSIIRQDEEYVNTALDKPINPIPLPVNVNKAGRQSLPSVTTTFF